MSYIADAARALIISGWDRGLIGKAFLAVAIFGVILNALAISAFRAQGR